MDTSETYIKMCEKAEEIQKTHRYEYGDYFIAETAVWIIGAASFVYEPDKQGLHHRLERPVATLSQTKSEDGVLTGELIWLPRQDQLQEMVDGGFTHQCFLGFCQWYKSGIYPHFTSMEQLWLAFVMKEKHQKAWNGETWT